MPSGKEFKMNLIMSFFQAAIEVAFKRNVSTLSAQEQEELYEKTARYWDECRSSLVELSVTWGE